MTLAEAMIAGYCIISRKYGIATRLDRRDWREHMAAQHAPWDPLGEGTAWVQALGNQAAHHYRCVHSQDKIVVGEAWTKYLRVSDWHHPQEYRDEAWNRNSSEIQRDILIEVLKINSLDNSLA